MDRGFFSLKGAKDMLQPLSDLLWGVPTIALMLLVGVLYTFRTRFVQIRKLGASFRMVGDSILHPTEGVSPFQAVCTALAATVGTGNIAGVAGAVALGGPGAVFWMWVSAFFGMATKYAEVVLAMGYRRKENGIWQGGAMYCIRDGMGRPRLAALFAVCAMLASFGMGNLAQVNTIAVTVRTAAEVYAPQLRPEPVLLFTGMVVAVLTALVTLGGAKRIGVVMERLVPVVAVAYIFGSCAVLAAHWEAVPGALSDIFRGAFSPQAVLGGGTGIGIRHAVRWGVSRGVFSNEAGLGSAPMAHAAAETQPEVQGLMGVFEVFLDTIVLCTLTALTILVSGIPIPYGKAAGAELAAEALETVFGGAAAGLLAICVALLALATLICWQLYGSRCAGYLFGSRGVEVYRLIYLAVILLGATMDLSSVWAVSDLFNGLMALPNLFMLLSLQKKVKKIK